MPTKKTVQKTGKRSVDDVTVTKTGEVSDYASALSNMTSISSRFGLQFNLLTVLIIALFVFQGYTFYQLKQLQKTGAVAGAAQPVESPLTQDKLLSYAKDLKLNEGDFKKCLESGAAASVVSENTKQGGELGVRGTPGFFINGKFLGGAFPIEAFKEIIDKEIAGTATGNCTDYSTGLQQYCTGDDPSFKVTPVEVSIGNSPTQGPKDAKVTIVEFSDFECPFCHRAFGTVEQILKDYPKDVKLVYKQFPLVSIHPHAQKAAEAAVCAQKQGKFWEMHDKLFKSQGA